jgi:hypothetical protein
MPIQLLSNAGQSGYRYKSLIAGITPVASVPTIGAATALTYSTASVAFTAPGAYAATTYTATSSPGGLTGTSATSPITVSGLSEQTAYTFTVTATNASGTSSPSAASSSITTPVAFTPDSGYDSLANVTLSATASSITFSGIPSGYKHLQIRISAQTNRASGLSDCQIQLNGDTGSNYSWHSLVGSGSAASASAGTSTAFMVLGSNSIPSSGSQANIYNGLVIDVLDYANTNKYKTLRGLGGDDANGSGYVSLNSGSWRNTSAITSIVIYPDTGSMNTYSSFALYGVK